MCVQLENEYSLLKMATSYAPHITSYFIFISAEQETSDRKIYIFVR